MTERNSRLPQTDFSQFNLRDAYITDQAEYVRAIRDEALFSNFGLKVAVKVPLDDDGNIVDNFIDEYSNFVNIKWLDTTESVIPLFKEYRQVLSENGQTADGTDGIYPLSVLIPTQLHLPRNSRIIFSEYNSREEMVAREWVVLGTELKQLSGSKTYSRVANCVPSRQSIFDSLNSSVFGNIYFSYELSEASIIDSLRASGTIWFGDTYIKPNMWKKHSVLNDIILEDTSDETTYLESMSVNSHYVSLPKYIQYATTGFVRNEMVPVYVVSGGENVPVMVEVDEAGTKQQLKILVTDVDSSGKLLGYKFVPENGYTEFKQDDVATIQSFDANGKLQSYEQIPSSITSISDYSGLPVANNIIMNIDTAGNVVRYVLVSSVTSATNSLNVIAVKDTSIFANIKAVSVKFNEAVIQETPETYDTEGTIKYVKPNSMVAKFSAKPVAISVLT